ncbi:uncharacterized protein LOC128559625 [Mercenaria mercenaria]|uniref:uncharacterized protein LOC128559625 n=1 Tax=Mercenaria mercenaria TaxID=6596 RepID=UPI00234E4B47|nr:uncharacterized protein LOC128559625 [Mercenaria mercenaria]
MFQDVNAEFLAFPKIYCGQARESNNARMTQLHYSTICKWELRNKDRRVASNVSNIFFKLKKVQIKQVADKVSLAVRKCKLKDGKLTVADVLNSENVANIVKHDEGYKVLRTLRGSPPYWEQAKKDIFAMIRQLRIPTWFCSFSAAETKWLSLLRILGKVVNKVHYSNEDIFNMTWQEKCELIKSDPVTYARYFDHRVQIFLSKVLQSNICPIGKITDFFYRVEFQQRGSPHIHMLIWIEQAPLVNSHSHSEIISFVDKYISCTKDEHMKTLVNYQTHRHARTCRKKGKSVCRFGFPLPPMTETMILTGLDTASNERAKAENNYCSIMRELEKLKLPEWDTSFTAFLAKFKLTYEEYILPLRSSIPAGKSKLFLKRSLAEIRVNSYNKTLLKCWEANMDIQYILDPFSCAAYIVSYISKGQRGMSNLLNEACKAARESASDIKQQLRCIGNVFLTNVEIGAQEAVYLLLQMPLRRSSRSVVFVNTNPPEDRVALIKPYQKLKEMSKNSTSIEADNCIKRYQRRPNTMSELCLADFIAWFDAHYTNKSDSTTSRHNLNSDIDLLEDVYIEDTTDDPVHESTNSNKEDSNMPLNEQTGRQNEIHYARDGSIFKKRQTCKVLYSVGFSIDNDREKHFREFLMLYLPWRSETRLIGEFSSFEEKYIHFKDCVEKNRQFYNSVSSTVITELNDELFSFTHEQNDIILPEEQHQNEMDSMEGSNQSEAYMSFDPGPPCNLTTYDLALDIGSGRKQLGQDEQIQGALSNEEYFTLVQTLNKKQKEFFYHVLLWQKTRTEPLYNFLSGGAGVGKSVLLKALYHALNKYYSQKIGANPDDINVLVCAPTGKAAYNIGGVTIHSAFNIPAEQGFNFKPLDMQQLGTFQAKSQHLKIIFIDEVSMVGQRMFNFINLRLQEIMATTKPFGGLSLVTFGDLYQLKPVMDKWIFSSSSSFQNSEDLATSLWEQYFTIFELDQIMRQQGDRIFAELLNRLREGCHLPADIQLLKQQVVDNNGNFSQIPHLFTKRAEVDWHNKTIYDGCSQEKALIHAIDTISGNFSKEMKSSILSKIPNDCSKTKGLSKILQIAENLPAELCSNVDVSDGMANGTPCSIKKLDYRVENSNRCSIIWVQFEEDSIGKKHRNRYKHLHLTTIPPLWTPILEITLKFSFNYYKSFHITRKQFPLHLSSAKTVHKAQGSTMAEAVIHFGSRKVEHMHYVALSRVRNLASVKILYLNENNISVSSAVVGEMERLRATSSVKLAIPLVYKFPSDSFTILYHNCRSLNKHIFDLRNEMNFLAADVIALSKTRLHTSLPSVNYDLPGFKLFRNDGCLNSRNCQAYHGSAIYMKNFISIPEVHNACDIEITTTYISAIDLYIRIIVVYCPPGKATIVNIKDLFSNLDIKFDLKNPTIVLGDFNFDLSCEHLLPSFLQQQYQLKQIISTPTTDYGSLLDHIYTNLINDRIFQSGTLEAYFSDHKPIYITIK